MVWQRFLSTLSAIEATFHAVRTLQDVVAAGFSQLERKMSALDDQITALKADVAALTAIEQKAETLLTGISEMVSDAVAHAQGAGATDAQLSALTDLDAKIRSETSALAAAVAAAQPAPPAPPVVEPPPAAEAPPAPPAPPAAAS